MPRYYCPGDELLSITLIGFSRLLCAGQPAFSSIRTENDNIWTALRLPLWCHVYHKRQHNTLSKITVSYKGKLPLTHWCVNSSGMLVLFITYFSSYSVHQTSWTEEAWGSMWTSCMLGCLFSGRRNAQRITERRRCKRPLAEEKCIHCCVWIAVRWWNSAQRVALTCTRKMCRHSCPGIPRLGEGLLFLLLLTKWREDISDFLKRRLPMKITVSPDW